LNYGGAARIQASNQSKIAMIKSPTLSLHFDVHQGIDRWENEGGRIGYGTQVSAPLYILPDASHWVRGISNVDRETRISLCPGTSADLLAGAGEVRRVGNRRAVVLLGQPGSGKTSLVRAQSRFKGLAAIETGNLLKLEIRRQTPLGQQIKAWTDSGGLAPATLVGQVISTELKHIQSDLILFDGFPRSAEQIGLFFQLLNRWRLDLGAVLVLSLSLPMAIRRLTGRRICAKCGALYNLNFKPSRKADECDLCQGKLIQRGDDTAEVITERFKSYDKETVPVIEYFQARFKSLVWKAPLGAPLDQIIECAGRRLKDLVGP
jgi:adenylate kinase